MHKRLFSTFPTPLAGRALRLAYESVDALRDRTSPVSQASTLSRKPFNPLPLLMSAFDVPAFAAVASAE